jgi:flagellar hook assembly protein FlgD
MSGADIAGALYFDDLQVQVSTGVKLNDSVVHKSFVLYQNYPNPFNPSTTIVFELERPEQATLAVFNTLGQRVATLINSKLEAGSHRVQFTGRGNDGRQLPSGVYLYRLQTSSGVEVKRMLLLK